MDSLFFVASKLLWALVEPGALVGLVIGAGVLALWLGRAWLGRALATLSLVALLAIGFLPLGDALLAPLEGVHLPAPTVAAPVVGIVVLGGAKDPATGCGRDGDPVALGVFRRVSRVACVSGTGRGGRTVRSSRGCGHGGSGG